MKCIRFTDGHTPDGCRRALALLQIVHPRRPAHRKARSARSVYAASGARLRRSSTDALSPIVFDLAEAEPQRRQRAQRGVDGAVAGQRLLGAGLVQQERAPPERAQISSNVAGRHFPVCLALGHGHLARHRPHRLRYSLQLLGLPCHRYFDTLDNEYATV